MTKKKKLIDFYFNPRDNGIFYSLFQDSDFAQLLNSMGITTEQEAHSIDMDYILNKSGLKTCSVLLHNFILGFVLDDNDDYVILRDRRKVSWDYVVTQIDQDIINSIIKIRYLKKWNTLLKTVLAEYDPLKPFNVEVADNTKRGLDSTRTNNTVASSKSKIEGSDSSTRHDGIYGFNSEDPSNSDISTSSSGTVSNSNIESNREGSETYGSDETTDRTITRSGNIGNRSSAELLMEQREYARFVLLEVIYSDLDEILTRSKYEVCYD